MSYTMTFDASHKVHHGSGHVTAFVRHIARDADQEAGFDFRHSNPNIIAERTALNESFVSDGEGGFRALESVDGRPPSAELENYLAQRLGRVKRPLRKDAVVMRGIVLQLDPKWFDHHCPDWREAGLSDEAEHLTSEALAWAAEEFGKENIVGGSIHLDEHSPQLQLIMAPVTDDGRLSQRDFFRGPGDLKRQHRDLRNHMEAAGYDVEHRVTERSTEHLSSEAYATRARRLEAKDRELSDFAEELDAESEELAKKRHNAAREGYADGKAQGLALVENDRQAVAEDRRAAEAARRVAEATQVQLREERELVAAEASELRRREAAIFESEEGVRELSRAYKAGLDEMQKRDIRPNAAEIAAKRAIQSAQARLRAAYMRRAAQQNSSDASHGLGE